MPRTAAKITQADIARVLRAVAASGMQARIEISQDGKISVEPVEAKGQPRYNPNIKL